MSSEATISPRGVDDLPGWVRRAWSVPLVLGIVLVVLGLLLLVNVQASLETLVWLVAISLFFAAIEAFATASLRSRPWVGWLVGFVYIVGAVVSIAWPGLTLFVTIITVGVSLLVGGVVQAAAAWRERASAHGWGWSFALGLLAVVAGLVFLFGSQAISLVVLAVVLAVYVLMTGFTLVVLAFAVRKATTFVTESGRAAPA